MTISNKIKTLVVGGIAVISTALKAGVASAVTVYCPDGKEAPGGNIGNCKGIKDNGNANVDLMKTVNTIINVIIGVIGFVAVVMIIYGGIQYTTSAGDSGKVKNAKNTILYGIVGLVVALLAFAIVSFVLSSIR